MQVHAADPTSFPGFSPDPVRVAEIAGWLPAEPRSVGPALTEQKAWQALAGDAWFQMKLGQIPELLQADPPQLTPELYLEYSKTGTRSNFEKLMGARGRRLSSLAIAACLEPSEAVLAALESEIRYHCARPAWVMPAHDKDLTNFHGTEITIDLASSVTGWQLAEISLLLGPKLSDEVQALLRSRVHALVIDPFSAMIRGERKPDWWLTVTNNWNSVCMSGVIGSVLALVDDRQERAYLVAAAEKLSQNYMRGFGKDGYCSEGLAYWNYGFGHYAMLAQTLSLATGGKLDLLSQPQAKLAASYPSRIHIMNTVYPAFSDAPPDVTASTTLLRALRHLMPAVPTPPLRPIEMPAYASLPEALLFSPLQGEASDKSPSPTPASSDWFEVAGVLVVRPGPNENQDFGVAMKGGHNAEHHNHNDLGSFVVVSGAAAVLIDPGKEVYTARSFGDRRYESDIMNSFGHSVPIVAGKLQETGAASVAKVLERTSNPEEERLRLDLSSAYAVEGLEQLERAFVFQRGTTPTFTVGDHVEFASPQSFGTALMIPPDAKVTPQDDGSYIVNSGAESVRVRAVAEGGELVMTTTELKDGIKPRRMGFDFKDPVKSGSISISIQPDPK